MADATLDHIRKLTPDTAWRAFWLVYATRVAGYPVVITSSRRTPEAQRALVDAGRSQTMASKHLTGEAFDIDWQGWNRNDVPQWFWDLLGPWAETQLGLRWGGRWRSLRDYGHFELPSSLRSRVA